MSSNDPRISVDRDAMLIPGTPITATTIDDTTMPTIRFAPPRRGRSGGITTGLDSVVSSEMVTSRVRETILEGRRNPGPVSERRHTLSTR